MAQKLFSQDEKYLTKGLGGSPTAIAAYVFVKEDTDTAEVVVCGDGEAAVGVVDAAVAATDERVRVVYAGITYVLASATIAVGAFVSSTATGTAVAHGTDDQILGRAMSPGVTGELMSVLLLQSVDTPSA